MVSVIIENEVQNGFFKNPEFRSFIQQCMKKMLSTNVVITPYPSSREMDEPNETPVKYAIAFLDEQREKQRLIQSVSVLVKNIFKTRQLQVFNDLAGGYYLF